MALRICIINTICLHFNRCENEIPVLITHLKLT
jgi:hypothetical protein